jgi:putative endonuclease
MWYVYIAQAKTGRYYVGMTENLQKRMHEHNTGRGSQFAFIQGPLHLVYTSCSFQNKSDARRREKQIKSWSRKKKEKLINKEWK